MAKADWLESQTNLDAARKAVALTPSSAFAHRNLAVMLGSADPFSAADEREFRAVTSLNARDSAAWIALAGKAEIAEHNREAEQYLLEAARIDHTFKPAWSLANYYARTNQPEQFWHWVRQSLLFVEAGVRAQGTYDSQPIFDLCWRMSSDAAFIQKTAIPQKAFVLQRYMLYLVGGGRLDAALAIAQELRPVATSQDTPYLLILCNALIADNNRDDAVAAWNILLDRHLIAHQQKLDPRNGVSLTNGDFSRKSVGQCFDWFLPTMAGVYANESQATHSIQFAFSGDEPENTDLLSQVVPLLPGQKYQFRFRYRTEDVTGRPGFHWALLEVPTNKSLAVMSSLAATDQEVQEQWNFETPADLGIGRLTLRYDRESGYTRPKGTLKVWETALELRR